MSIKSTETDSPYNKNAEKFRKKFPEQHRNLKELISRGTHAPYNRNALDTSTDIIKVSSL